MNRKQMMLTLVVCGGLVTAGLAQQLSYDGTHLHYSLEVPANAVDDVSTEVRQLIEEVDGEPDAGDQEEIQETSLRVFAHAGVSGSFSYTP